ncbi:MAG: hypothetical protein JWP37_592 [Mucilaginibacter sp.]|nr:hypothetical protein [Mucilaginibacter sp.]
MTCLSQLTYVPDYNFLKINFKTSFKALSLPSQNNGFYVGSG